MKTESFVLQSPEKFRREGLTSLIVDFDKLNDQIFVIYLNENNKPVDSAAYSYTEYMREIYNTNGIGK